MIIGMHATMYSTDAEKDRAFLRDTLGLTTVDAGGGWLVFALPPAELSVHPTDSAPTGEMADLMEFYLLCDDVNATITELREKGVDMSGEISDEGWGLVTSIPLPGGGKIGMYEPRHPTAMS
ncbi:VOC family protein [Actinoplanes aureus]|jgi:catechol 2,3-dioxygenase-like lactoylglutathione lyase family enzyme|uniref:VOC family protein n=1 Tax=Actinoplanes aureus TaxID=2792083 RepID=A0A931G0N9_9ACTN|nr:VOC family protein [Actinoplanes aureus]MBG0566100.1 VOC family protein [Actinoplanes aureus]